MNSEFAALKSGQGAMLYLSLFDWNFISPMKTFVGLQNFIDLFQDEEFLQVLKFV